MSKHLFWRFLEVFQPKTGSLDDDIKILHGDTIIATLDTRQAADWVVRCVNRCIELDCEPEELVKK